MKRMLCTVALAFGGLAVLTAAQTANADLASLDSSAFTWKYEMTEDPTTQDLDGNTAADFAGYSKNGGSGTYGGVWSYDASGTKQVALLGATTTDRIWANSGITHAAGFTVEARIKIKTSTGTDGAFEIAGAPADQTGAEFGLSVAGTGEYWRTIGSPQIDTSSNNLDGAFHVFRLAQAPGASTFSLWRDGVLLTNSLTSTNSANDAAVFNVGSDSGSLAGTVDVDYVRFTPGAYAPAAVPEPSSIVMCVIGLLAYAWRRRKSQ